MKVKTSNFFYQSAFTQNAAFFVSIICAWIIEVEKTKHKRKVSRLRQNMQSSRQNEREFSRRKRETFFVVVQKGISLQYIALCMKTAILETFFFVYASIFSHHSGEQEDIRGGWFSEQYVVVGSFQGFSSNFLFLFLQQVRRNATFFSTKSQRTIFFCCFFIMLSKLIFIVVVSCQNFVWHQRSRDKNNVILATAAANDGLFQAGVTAAKKSAHFQLLRVRAREGTSILLHYFTESHQKLAMLGFCNNAAVVFCFFLGGRLDFSFFHFPLHLKRDYRDISTQI